MQRLSKHTRETRTRNPSTQEEQDKLCQQGPIDKDFGFAGLGLAVPVIFFGGGGPTLNDKKCGFCLAVPVKCSLRGQRCHQTAREPSVCCPWGRGVDCLLHEAGARLCNYIVTACPFQVQPFCRSRRCSRRRGHNRKRHHKGSLWHWQGHFGQSR